MPTSYLVNLLSSFLTLPSKRFANSLELLHGTNPATSAFADRGTATNKHSS